MKKSDLILFYQGAIKMQSKGIPETQTDKNLQLNPIAVTADPNLNMMEHLFKHGWAVTSIPNFNPVEIRKEFHQWLHHVCDRFDPENAETWINQNMPHNYHGVFIHYINHTEFMWKTREAYIPIFEHIWGTKDLLSSFDGGCFLTNKYQANFKNWMHCDQGRTVTHFACVQGIVNLYENGPEDGGTILMNNSASKFTEYLEAHPIDGISAFFPIDHTDPILNDCTIIKPCLKAGEILLLDSRTFHCNIAPRSNNLRMCLFVSMMPRSYATQEELQKRIELYNDGRGTGHWCYGPFFKVNPKHANPMYSKDCPKPETVEIAELNPVRRKLIGYND